MSYDVRAWLSAARRQERELEEQLSELRRRYTRTEHAATEVRAEVARTAEQLGELLLPELTPAALQRAAALTGCDAVLADDPVGKLEAERSALQAELNEIEASPAVQDYERLYGPGGEKRRQLEEVERELGPMTRFVRAAAHERLDHLIDVGYGTDVYEVPWWRMSYYADWKAGDEILEQVGEKYPTWVEFVAEYMRVTNQRQGLLNERDDLKRDVDGAEELRRRKTTVGVKLGTLEEVHARDVREALVAYVAAADPSVFQGRLDGAPDVAAAIKRWRGLEAKQVYLDRLREMRLERREQELSRQLAKVRRKMVKYQRPKKRYTRFSEDEFSRTFKDRSGKYAKYWRKYDRDYDLIVGFDDYDCWGYEDDFLWWDVMVDGRYDGAWIPEVEAWRLDHPGYVYERPVGLDDDFDDGAAAAAVAAADYEDEEDGSFSFDAS